MEKHLKKQLESTERRFSESEKLSELVLHSPPPSLPPPAACVFPSPYPPAAIQKVCTADLLNVVLTRGKVPGSRTHPASSEGI